jgi:hypothetical protein
MDVSKMTNKPVNDVLATRDILRGRKADLLIEDDLATAITTVKCQMRHEAIPLVDSLSYLLENRFTADDEQAIEQKWALITAIKKSIL